VGNNLLITEVEKSCQSQLNGGRVSEEPSSRYFAMPTTKDQSLMLGKTSRQTYHKKSSSDVERSYQFYQAAKEKVSETSRHVKEEFDMKLTIMQEQSCAQKFSEQSVPAVPKSITIDAIRKDLAQQRNRNSRQLASTNTSFRAVHSHRPSHSNILLEDFANQPTQTQALLPPHEQLGQNLCQIYGDDQAVQFIDMRKERLANAMEDFDDYADKKKRKHAEGAEKLKAQYQAIRFISSIKVNKRKQVKNVPVVLKNGQMVYGQIVTDPPKIAKSRSSVILNPQDFQLLRSQGGFSKEVASRPSIRASNPVPKENPPELIKTPKMTTENPIPEGIREYLMNENDDILWEAVLLCHAVYQSLKYLFEHHSNEESEHEHQQLTLLLKTICKQQMPERNTIYPFLFFPDDTLKPPHLLTEKHMMDYLTRRNELSMNLDRVTTAQSGFAHRRGPSIEDVVQSKRTNSRLLHCNSTLTGLGVSPFNNSLALLNIGRRTSIQLTPLFDTLGSYKKHMLDLKCYQEMLQFSSLLFSHVSQSFKERLATRTTEAVNVIQSINKLNIQSEKNNTSHVFAYIDGKSNLLEKETIGDIYSSIQLQHNILETILFFKDLLGYSANLKEHFVDQSNIARNALNRLASSLVLRKEFLDQYNPNDKKKANKHSSVIEKSNEQPVNGRKSLKPVYRNSKTLDQKGLSQFFKKIAI